MSFWRDAFDQIDACARTKRNMTRTTTTQKWPLGGDRRALDFLCGRVGWRRLPHPRVARKPDVSLELLARALTADAWESYART